uniref:Recombinase family protein n=1 Tax=Phenylobacterium glaciei TaxID=2803784 RepID=A0A974P1Y8_9CAUL|nr:recombinase family protein [Phenylobacterium glaciei]
MYSIENQRSAIASYAVERGFEVVCSYVDAGRSGLTLTGRPGLKALLSDALGPAPDFRAILVFDVSRWGRFQDVDQGLTTSSYVAGPGWRSSIASTPSTMTAAWKLC